MQMCSNLVSDLKSKEIHAYRIINRPGVAGAVIQTALLPTD